MRSATWFRKPLEAHLPPRIVSLVSAVIDELRKYPDDDYIVPKFIAKSINESEISVVTALRYLERAGIAKQWFGVFCGNTDIPLKQYSSASLIPDSLPCEKCEEDHRASDESFKVQIFYTIDRQKLNHFDLQDLAA
jgi:hypothetical protein